MPDILQHKILNNNPIMGHRNYDVTGVLSGRGGDKNEIVESVIRNNEGWAIYVDRTPIIITLCSFRIEI